MAVFHKNALVKALLELGHRALNQILVLWRELLYVFLFSSQDKKL